MKKNIILSICIPTHNRAQYLEKNLMVLKDIVSDDVEIVISNDASTDLTDVVIRNFISNYSHIRVRYFKSRRRLGFDRNVIKVVKGASGDFCWLLGDDDLPEMTSVDKIKSVIAKNPTISFIQLNYARFDNLLKQITATEMIKGIDRDVLFKNYVDYFFRKTKTCDYKFLGTNSVTLCTDVVNRRKWLEASRKLKRFLGHNFIHSFIIGTIIRPDNSVYFISKPQVNYLANNIRVWPNNVWKDYNSLLLDYLQNIGYPKDKILEMRKSQTEIERKEAFMKNKFFGRIYVILRPFYARLQLLRAKYA